MHKDGFPPVINYFIKNCTEKRRGYIHKINRSYCDVIDEDIWSQQMDSYPGGICEWIQAPDVTIPLVRIPIVNISIIPM